jgi:hypothetical protein
MPLPRMQFSLRRLMIIIVAAALLLAACMQVMEWRRRQVLIEQYRAEIELYQVAQAQANAMAEQARRSHDPPEDVRQHENDSVQLREEVQSLRQKLSRLQR